MLFVNLPAWRAPVEPAFPLGNTGVTFIPEYVLLGQALHVNGVGHATTLFACGLPVVLYRALLPVPVETGAETTIGVGSSAQPPVLMVTTA